MPTPLDSRCVLNISNILTTTEQLNDKLQHDIFILHHEEITNKIITHHKYIIKRSLKPNGSKACQITQLNHITIMGLNSSKTLRYHRRSK
jgi:hypothetical protein